MHLIKYIKIAITASIFLPFAPLSADSQKILISGFTIHDKEKNRFGEDYNEFNYGLGYEYRFEDKESNWYPSLMVMGISDSYSNFQGILGGSFSYRVIDSDVSVDFGVGAFISAKKRYSSADTDRSEGNYKLVGGGAPLVTVEYESLSLSLLYVPTVKTSYGNTVGFFYLYGGVKF